MEGGLEEVEIPVRRLLWPGGPGGRNSSVDWAHSDDEEESKSGLDLQLAGFRVKEGLLSPKVETHCVRSASRFAPLGQGYVEVREGQRRVGWDLHTYHSQLLFKEHRKVLGWERNVSLILKFHQQNKVGGTVKRGSSW